jgi:dihydroneopterin aldolase
MDLVRIRDLQVEAHVGVTEEERAVPQTLLVNLDLQVDTVAAGASDDLADTVDYGDIATTVADLIRGMRPSLLEHLAERIAGAMEDYPKITGIAVEVMKVNPPIPEKLGSVGVRIERAFR